MRLPAGFVKFRPRDYLPHISFQWRESTNGRFRATEPLGSALGGRSATPRWPRRSRPAAAAEADVGEGRRGGSPTPDGRARRGSRRSGSPTKPGLAAGRARVAAGAERRVRRRGERDRDAATEERVDEPPDRGDAEEHARRRPGRRWRCADRPVAPPVEDAHRLVALERRQEQRPAHPGADDEPAVRSTRGARPATVACSTLDTCSTRQASRRHPAGLPAGRALAEVAGRARGSPAARRRGRRSARRGVDADLVEALADDEGRPARVDAVERRPRPAAARPARQRSVVRRRTSGRWSASSNSASLSMRPSTRT